MHELDKATLIHAGRRLALPEDLFHLLAHLAQDFAHRLPLKRAHEALPPSQAGHCKGERRSARAARGSSIWAPCRRSVSCTSDLVSGERRSTRTTGRLCSTARQQASGSNGSTALSGSPKANSYSHREKSFRARCWLTTMPVLTSPT